MAIGGTENLSKLDALVYDHSVRNIDAVGEFVSAKIKHGLLNGVERRSLTIEQRLDMRIKLSALTYDAA
ncbi:MAG: hypothetical protein ABR69_00860 [OM182 bacterium BACL3 MAG-120507-bin80]|uniref:Uncharacterized protein n=1 Tax=OM182 bacterium BACL3 MAG-120507-bin80 TaxID=1655577 RepID=A0A0R2S4Z4_9GAMM|nr:MAG: hypothetical protein ABR69_00860 [OM182 bacterium BACL3 MAG-120507-bin80]